MSVASRFARLESTCLPIDASGNLLILSTMSAICSGSLSNVLGTVGKVSGVAFASNGTFGAFFTKSNEM